MPGAGRKPGESSLPAELLGVMVGAAVGAYVARRTNRWVGTITAVLVVPVVERSATRLATAIGV